MSAISDGPVEHQQDPARAKTLAALKPILTSTAFMCDLDALSADVIRLLSDFAEEHFDQLIGTLGQETHLPTVLDMLLGWIAGFGDAGGDGPTTPTIGIAAQRILVISFVAGWSVDNSARLHRSKVQ
jgi:hypothetical protein